MSDSAARIAILVGSNRSQSNSHRIGEIAATELARLGAESDLVSLRDIDLPLWDETKKSAEDGFWAERWPAISDRLSTADGFVVIAPEWHGMAPPALKNLLFCCDNRELAFKPAYLIAVSASVGGAYPIAELRMSGYKNCYIHWLPDHLIVRSANGFRPGEDGHTAPDFLAPRMTHGLEILCAYAKAARPIRRDVVDLDRLKNGM